MSSTQRYTLTIPALGAQSAAVTGAAVLILDTSFPVMLTTNNGVSTTLNRGDTLRLAPGELFTGLTFENPNNEDITVEFYAGHDVPRNDSISITDYSRTFIRANAGQIPDGSGEYHLPAAAKLAVPGTNAYGDRRKAIIITNLDGSRNLKVRRYTTSNNRIATVFPLSALMLETDADLCIENPDAGAEILIEICETFYTKSDRLVAD